MVRTPLLSELFDLPPPHSVDAERAVIGALLADLSHLVAVTAIIKPSDFHVKDLGAIFDHLQNFPHDGIGAADVTLLLDWIRSPGDVEKLGPTIAECFQHHPLAIHAPHYATIIKELAEKRRLIRVFTKSLQYIYKAESNPSKLAQAVRTKLEELHQKPQSIFTEYTCAELIKAHFDMQYLVENLLVAGQPCILAGPKKSLKTSLLIDLSIALTRGGYFLGRFKVPQETAVGLMTGESGLATIQETIIRICDQAGYLANTITNLIITDTVPRFGDARHDEAVREFITTRALEVLIIDPIYMAMSGVDAGNIFIQGERLANITKICQDADCTLILAHHTRKTIGMRDPHAPPELEDISWAGFQEFARQWLLVNRREPYEPGTGSHRLWLSVGGSAGHGGLWGVDIEEGIRNDAGGLQRRWVVDVTDPTDARQASKKKTTEAKSQEKQQKIKNDAKTLYAYMDKPERVNGETERVWSRTTGIFDRKFKDALSYLVQEGHIIPCQITKSSRNTPYEGWKINPPPTTQ